jgi:hypothetical protein
MRRGKSSSMSKGEKEESIIQRGTEIYEVRRRKTTAYEIRGRLGTGGFATCYEIRILPEKRQKAVKVFSKTSKRIKNIEKVHFP